MPTMLRNKCLPRRASIYFILSSRFLAVSFGIAVTGCSANVSRFDAPMFGLTDGGNRTASVPIPRESVLAYQGSAPSSHGGYSGSPSSGSYAAASGSSNGGYGGYGSGPTNSGYRGGPSQPSYHRPTYNQPSYQASNQAPPTYQPSSQPSYQQAPGTRSLQQNAYPQRTEPAYAQQLRQQERTRMAALPPSSLAADRSPPAPAATPEQKTINPAGSQTSSRNPRLVEVQPGDTLFSLAQRNKVSISELMRLNGMASPSVRPGQKILLPEAPSAVAAAVRQGPASEPRRVAALTAPGPASLSDSEQQPAPSGISTPVLDAAIPNANTAAEAGESYTIRSGESLYGIAVRHGIPLAELQRINNITDPRKVKAGTVLRLPARPGAPALVASAPEPKAPADPKPAVSEQAAAEPASTGAGSATNPFIINAPAPSQQVAALDKSGDNASAIDAAPVAAAPQSAEQAKPTEPASPEEAKADAAGKLRWPVRGKVIAGFGKQADGSYNDGIKLSVPVGAEVHAAESGVVAYAGNELKGYGNLVLLRHDNGWITAYAHNNELSVKRGDRVRRGQVIAKAGNTGSADKPQLHFELRQGSSPVDPIPHMESL